MNRLFILSLLFFLSMHLFGQSTSEQSFYTYLQTQLKQALVSGDSIIVTENSRAGNIWKAVIKQNNTECIITFLSDKFFNNSSPDSFPVYTTVDTSFIIPTKTLLNNFEIEKMYLKNKLIISYTSQDFSVNRKKINKRFHLQKGQGLYYWLRFNKSWEDYI